MNELINGVVDTSDFAVNCFCTNILLTKVGYHSNLTCLFLSVYKSRIEV